MTRYDGKIPLRAPTYTTFLYVGLAIATIALFVWAAFVAGV